jgi:DNA-binding response OmpR family regulator
VVEDDATVATALLACLEEDGRTLHLAGSAAEAEQILAAHPIDLVILDLILPDRDGRDLLLQLREDPRSAGVPVIVLSARVGPVTRAECLTVGARALLEKPADPELLRREVALHLREHRRDLDARVDPGTGLLSRAGLSEAYRSLRSRSGKVEGPLAVALLVVEPFDRVLRTRGRVVADSLMRAVGEQVRSALEARDELGRWSDPELLALLPGTSAPDTRGLLEEGLTRLAAGGVLDEHLAAGLELRFSAGIAVADRGVELREAALTAEQSMQRAHLKGSALTFAGEPSAPARRIRVLLVEDDRVTATLIQHRLVREGFEVMDFLNGEDAFRWASDASFDLAILDVNVPGLDGFEILERIRAIPRLAHVPTIMLTGLGREADVVRGLELGANDYMLKPFSPAELLARVRRLAEE